jgi:two-component system, OmpR family, alkaline phosphatase synthesis response regulator PhoP
MTYRVLLCDDEVPILRAAEFKIRKAGHKVRIASDGEEAWTLIQEEIPDILVTDCQMPRLDGLGLVRRLRDCDATRHLPVLMLTAKGLELDAAELAREWNVIELIGKPFSPRGLLDTITRVLSQQTVTT